MADDHWLRSDDAAGGPVAARRAGALLAMAVAVAAAITVPGVAAGVQLPVLAVLGAAAVHLARPRVLAPSEVGLVALGMALAAMAALRDASWIVGVDLLASAGLATVVVTRAVRWREILAAPLAVAARLPGAPAFLRGSRPGREGRARALRPAFRGASLGAALLLVFGGLFVSADRAFADLASRFLVPDVDLSLVPARVLVAGLALLGIGALARVGETRMSDGDEGRRAGIGVSEWVIALALLDLVFIAFVAVQLAVLFGGRTHVLSTAGLSYAEYARQGFFQLVGVGALTLAVVAGAVRWARRERPAHTRVLQALLGVLCLCTLVVLASAFRRLDLYESVFGSTRLRVSVRGTILWMGALFALVLVAGARMRGRWLPRAALVLTAASLLLFTLVNPDGLIAERNVRRFEATGRLDLDYVRSLSADAVPALADLPPRLRCWALEPVAGRLAGGEPAVGWNLARVRARAVLVARVGEERPVCDAAAPARHPGVTWRG